LRATPCSNQPILKSLLIDAGPLAAISKCGSKVSPNGTSQRSRAMKSCHLFATPSARRGTAVDALESRCYSVRHVHEARAYYDSLTHVM
jgi:hypothetical protein